MACDVSLKSRLSTLNDENVLLKTQVDSVVQERENIKLEYQKLTISPNVEVFFDLPNVDVLDGGYLDLTLSSPMLKIGLRLKLHLSLVASLFSISFVNGFVPSCFCDLDLEPLSFDFELEIFNHGIISLT
ncbi:hypothetical protein Tco_1023534 [Tanacetum coccineum]